MGIWEWTGLKTGRGYRPIWRKIYRLCVENPAVFIEALEWKGKGARPGEDCPLCGTSVDDGGCREDLGCQVISKHGYCEMVSGYSCRGHFFVGSGVELIISRQKLALHCLFGQRLDSSSSIYENMGLLA